MRIIQSHSDSTNESIKRIEAQINLLITAYKNYIALLYTIPVVNRNRYRHVSVIKSSACTVTHV